MSKSKQPPKPTSEKLNNHQREALIRASRGDYLPLIMCCLDCHKAEDKALKAIEMGVVQWGEKTAMHYSEIRVYLEEHIDSDEAFNFYESLLSREE